jgi:hypothetical protein
MGREIRNVKPGWEHPKWNADDAPRETLVGKLKPLYDEDYETAADKWLENAISWHEGKHPDRKPEYKYWWDWDGGPPDRDSYRAEKWTPEEATWVQMYETVSEGTPVTPAFATREELVDYLVNNGDRFYQGGQRNPWTRHNAESFVASGWAPSGIATGGKFYTADTMGDIPK